MGSSRFASIDHLPEPHRSRAREKLQSEVNAEMSRRIGDPREREPETPKKPRSKYGAERMKIDGHWFDSKREGKHYLRLCDQVAKGQIKRFHRQVPIDLEGGVVYILDFLVVTNDDELIYQDAKGFSTKEFKIKARMVKARYGIEVVLV